MHAVHVDACVLLSCGSQHVHPFGFLSGCVDAMQRTACSLLLASVHREWGCCAPPLTVREPSYQRLHMYFSLVHAHGISVCVHVSLGCGRRTFGCRTPPLIWAQALAPNLTFWLHACRTNGSILPGLSCSVSYMCLLLASSHLCVRASQKLHIHSH